MTTIMIVEDNPDIQALLKEVLAPQATLIQVLDGSSALIQFDETTVDLVILDLMLPGVTGESVLSQIRKQSTVPILVLTAIQDKDKIVALLNAGANDYLTKPFDLDELLARVNVQLRRNLEAPLADKLTVEDLILDEKTHTVNVAGTPLLLPKKEFDLLATLMRRPHQVFEKEMLYEKIWGEPYINADNTLNVHISNLRTKLNQLSPAQKYITTVWGIGVRLL